MFFLSHVSSDVYRKGPQFDQLHDTSRDHGCKFDKHNERRVHFIFTVEFTTFFVDIYIYFLLDTIFDLSIQHNGKSQICKHFAGCFIETIYFMDVHLRARLMRAGESPGDFRAIQIFAARYFQSFGVFLGHVFGLFHGTYLERVCLSRVH